MIVKVAPAASVVQEGMGIIDTVAVGLAGHDRLGEESPPMSAPVSAKGSQAATAVRKPFWLLFCGIANAP